MTNEDLKKLVNYSFQLSTFALGLQDDATAMNNDTWQEISKDLLMTAQKMDKSIAEQKSAKVA